jgi:uncharacterized protein (DUF983 family)
MGKPIPRLRTLITRGWRKKCPQCDQGELYHRWMRLYDHCPVCGLKSLESQGDLFGPLVLLDRVLFLIPLVSLFYFGVWHPTLVGFLLVGGTLMFLLIYTMPNRNGVSLAIDYFIRRKEGALRHGQSGPQT